ncbi:hypothetical protein JTE90_014943 [Oedothorax gibbosus]|uniref:Uncharacterized protein n=1 Tax=Oedothorax gibbosus TaxID=931172 RepID=A0AAV6UYG0_9ARAC|nr:hypothetical protein JTE90_014943 [Oedothorax gibbosus]
MISCLHGCWNVYNNKGSVRPRLTGESSAAIYRLPLSLVLMLPSVVFQLRHQLFVLRAIDREFGSLTSN